MDRNSRCSPPARALLLGCLCAASCSGELAQPDVRDGGKVVKVGPGEFLIVVDSEQGNARLVRGDPAALTEIAEGTGTDQVDTTIVGFAKDAACGVADGFCLDVQLTSYFAGAQLDNTFAELTNLTSGTTVANSDAPAAGVDTSLGAWGYGTLAPPQQCGPGGNNAGARRWAFETSVTGSIGITGRILADVNPVAPVDCGSDCNCQACNCTQSCSGDCESTCTDGAVCELIANQGNNVMLSCTDSTCSLACTDTNNCETYCNSTATCSGTCDASNNCKTFCSDSTSCDFSCDQSNNCEINCVDESTCNIACADNNNCKTTCEDDANCDLTCNDDENCTLECKGSSSCQLNCVSGDCEMSCDGTRRNCGGGVTTCNRPCP